jgi:hypothetical protein
VNWEVTPQRQKGALKDEQHIFWCLVPLSFNQQYFVASGGFKYAPLRPHWYGSTEFSIISDPTATSFSRQEED